ncbi:MAG: hypothetical protein Q7J74_05205 [Pseudomonas sp.]|nr:hypothetical protein [Pseudomonas sp.]
MHINNYQPITGLADYMYQNVTLLPLAGATGSIEHICVVIYDATQAAMHKQQLDALSAAS